MVKRTPEIYQVPDEQARLFPEVSGNAINGLGEAAARRPRQIYWHRAENLAHGDLQNWMVANYNKHPRLSQVFRGPGSRGPAKLDPVAETARIDTPAGWSAAVKDFALRNEAELVGIARFDPAWVFEGYDIEAPWIVVLGIAMDHGRLATAPAVASAVEVADQYNRGVRAAKSLAGWIRANGWQADPHGGPWAGPITLIPAALACGFGELGKHGSIINRSLGSSFRLAAVLTDLPLVADDREAFGADEFCAACRVCTDACPPRAISPAKQTVRGAHKWYVDFDKCIPYFNETYGCGICIAVCPWSRPGIAPRLAAKLARRARGSS